MISLLWGLFSLALLVLKTPHEQQITFTHNNILFKIVEKVGQFFMIWSLKYQAWSDLLLFNLLHSSKTLTSISQFAKIAWNINLEISFKKKKTIENCVTLTLDLWMPWDDLWTLLSCGWLNGESYAYILTEFAYS